MYNIQTNITQVNINIINIKYSNSSSYILTVSFFGISEYNPKRSIRTQTNIVWNIYTFIYEQHII